MSREFTQVGVVGLGTMGAGIAEVLARYGISVVAVEVDEAARRGRSRAHRAVRPRAPSPAARPVSRSARPCWPDISVGTDLAALAEADLVIEAVPE